jgi:hypothetical protein
MEGKLSLLLEDCYQKGRFQWSEQAQGAFDKLKRAMVSAPVLILPDLEKLADYRKASDAGIEASKHLNAAKENVQSVRLDISFNTKDLTALRKSTRVERRPSPLCSLPANTYF